MTSPKILRINRSGVGGSASGGFMPQRAGISTISLDLAKISLTLQKVFIVGWAMPTTYHRSRRLKVGTAHPTSAILGDANKYCCDVVLFFVLVLVLVLVLDLFGNEIHKLYSSSTRTTTRTKN
jgi:hypothetical protein